MTVAELIEKLQRAPQDEQVVLDPDCANVNGVYLLEGAVWVTSEVEFTPISEPDAVVL